MTVHELRIEGKHGAAIGLASAVATRLATKDTVEFAALKPPHPLHEHCTVVVRTADATSTSCAACEELCTELRALLSALPEEPVSNVEWVPALTVSLAPYSS